MTQRTFTDPYIRNLKAKDRPYKRAEYAPKGEGRLTVRVLPTGVKEFFYRYRANGIDKTIAIGRYDSTGKNGKTLAELRKAVREKRDLQEQTGDVKEHLRAVEREKQIACRKGTFGQLLDAYIDALKAAKKPSAVSVEGIFKRHVRKPFPAVVDTMASDIEPAHIQRILARMVKAGITRQVNVTRSYLRAAFAHGMAADYDPRTTAKDGVLFALKANPAAGIKRIQEYERTCERVLSNDELRDYWNALAALPPVQAATLRFNLAIACQRMTQLLRADWAAFSFEKDAETMLLRDPKGRGGARDHLLPLTPFALEQLKPLRELHELRKQKDSPEANKAETPFTIDGKRPLVLETLSACVSEVSKVLTEAKEKEYAKFQLRDLRRTCETALQKLGIDKEVRAHLLSHGRTQGVQGMHYERYDFLKEKRKALLKWNAHLKRIIKGNDTETGKVVEGHFGKAA